MKALFICILLPAAACSVPSLFAQQTPAPTSDTVAAEGAVRQVNAEEIQAFVHNDPKAMARLWADEFIVVNPLNKLVNKSQVLAMVQSGLLAATSYDRQIDYVRVDGDFAIVAGIETVTWAVRCSTPARLNNSVSPAFGKISKDAGKRLRDTPALWLRRSMAGD